MTSGADRPSRLRPVAGVLVERATAHAHGHTLFLHVPMWSGVDSPGRLWHFAGGRLAAEPSGSRWATAPPSSSWAASTARRSRFLDAVAAGQPAVAEPARVAASRSAIAETIRERRPEYRP